MPGGACCAAGICCPPAAQHAALAAKINAAMAGGWLGSDPGGDAGDIVLQHFDLAPKGLAAAVKATWRAEPGVLEQAVRALYEPLFKEAAEEAGG